MHLDVHSSSAPDTTVLTPLDLTHQHIIIQIIITDKQNNLLDASYTVCGYSSS